MDTAIITGVVGVVGTTLGALAPALGSIAQERRNERASQREKAETWRSTRLATCTTFVCQIDELEEAGRNYLASTDQRDSAVVEDARSRYLSAWSEIATGLGPVQLTTTATVADEALKLWNAAQRHSSEVDRTAEAKRWSEDDEATAAEARRDLNEARKSFISVARRELTSDLATR